MLHFAVSSCLCVQLQPVDVLPRMAVQVTGLHGPVRAVCPGWAGHQRSSRPGEEIKQLSLIFCLENQNHIEQDTGVRSVSTPCTCFFCSNEEHHCFLVSHVPPTQAHNHLYLQLQSLLSVLSNVELRVSAQVADECLAPDVLSTVKELKAVNFRRVPKMPVYGLAQPTSEVQLVSLLFCHLYFVPQHHLGALKHGLFILWTKEIFFVCYVLGLSDSIVGNKSRERAWDLMINNLKLCMPPFYFGITDMPNRFRDRATIWVICKILDLAFLLLVI